MMGGQEEKEERRERELWSMDRGLQMHDGKKGGGSKRVQNRRCCLMRALLDDCKRGRHENLLASTVMEKWRYT